MTKSSTILLGVSILACGVALGSVCIGYKAAGQAEAYMQECLALRVQLNQAHKRIASLVQAQGVRKNELLIQVRDTSKRRSVARSCRNFGNVKQLPNGQKWLGEIGVDRQGHVIFESEGYGLRACALTLLSYEKRHGIKTIRQLLNRYCEGNKAEYEAFLCRGLKLKPTQQFSIKSRLWEILPLMVRYESGEEMPSDYKQLMKVAAL